MFLPRSRFSPRFARSRRNFLAVGLLPSRRNLVSLARTPSRSLSLADTTPNILDVEKETLKAGAEERRGDHQPTTDKNEPRSVEASDEDGERTKDALSRTKRHYLPFSLEPLPGWLPPCPCMMYEGGISLRRQERPTYSSPPINLGRQKEREIQGRNVPCLIDHAAVVKAPSS